MLRSQMPLVTTKADAAYAEIHRRIVEGVLPPGTVLDQGALARDLNISTTPVREALRRLEMEKLVEMSAHRDARVAPMSPQHFRYLCEVRLELDPLAAGLAAERATKAEIDTILRTGGASGRTAVKRASVNRSFHRAVYTACHNPVLVEELDSLWDRTNSYRLALRRAYPGAGTPASHEHTAIAAAVRDRNASEVRALVRAHLEDSFRKVDALLAADGTKLAPVAGD